MQYMHFMFLEDVQHDVRRNNMKKRYGLIQLLLKNTVLSELNIKVVLNTLELLFILIKRKKIK